MDLNQLFLKKEDWQINTFEKVKSELISAKNNRFVRYENSRENHLVMIYGKSQVGKTTLILNMIGLKQEYFKEAYDTLRAGVPRGNSSTSTAIIYSKSSTNKYGCSLSNINEVFNKNIEFYDKTAMISKLKKIRQDVESNCINANNILFIYFPNNYFIDDSATDNVSIMDMPGIESRNHKEDIHVQNLMNKYIPISSVCIIACRSNDIQQLESLVLPNGIDWKRMPHRFILVTTHAYIDGTTKKFFDTERSNRKCCFYEYVTNAYTREIRKILGENNQTEVYPIDVGDTLLKLCNDEIKDLNDRKEIYKTKDRVLLELRHSIVSRKGNRLKSTLTDLEIIANHYGEDEIADKKEKISKNNTKITDRTYLINKTENRIENLKNDIEELKSYEQNKKYDKQKLEALYSYIIYGLFNDISNYIENNSLSKEKKSEKYIYDKEKQIKDYLCNIVCNISESFLQALEQIKREAEIKYDIDSSAIIGEAVGYVYNHENMIYPPKKGFFTKKEKVFIESDLKLICDEIQNQVNLLILKHINACKTIIEKETQDIKYENNKIHQIIQNEKNKIKKYSQEITVLAEDSKKLNDEIKVIIKKRNNDKITLSMYLNYAKEEYMKQRDMVINNINRCNDVNDKMLLILFLGILDKEYQKTVGGFHEE